MKIDGAHALITGGGSGLGEGAARMLVGRGARVTLLDLEESAAGELAAELGDAALFVPTDVSDPDAVEAAFERSLSWTGRLDLAVNCAGISPAIRVLGTGIGSGGEGAQMHPLETFQRVMDVNVVGLFDVVRRSAAAIARNEPGDDGERGLIVNVSSIAAFEGKVGQAAYSASKGAVAALTIQLARDLAPEKIRVMSVAPGMMDTAMLGSLPAKARKRLVDHHVFPRRLGTPEEFGRLLEAFCEIPLLNGEVVRMDAAARLPPR